MIKSSVLLRRTAATIAFFIALIVIQEFSIRLAMPDFNPSKHLEFSWHVDDLTLGQPGAKQRQIKNTGDFNVEVQFNRYGLRDKQDVGLAGSKDFIFVGDSFIFGWGVPEHSRVTNQLAEMIGRKVFNVAVPGNLDTYEHLIEYAHHKTRTPTRVIIGLSLETDINTYMTEVNPSAGSHEIKTRAAWINKVKNFLTLHSALYFLVTQQIHQLPALRSFAVKLGLILPNLNEDRANIPTPEAILSTARRTIAIAWKYDATIVLIPSRYTWFGPKHQALSDIHEQLAQLFQAGGIDMVDLKPVFEVGGEPLEFHFKNDGHWQPEGHAKVADILARHLKLRFADAL